MGLESITRHRNSAKPGLLRLLKPTLPPNLSLIPSRPALPPCRPFIRNVFHAKTARIAPHSSRFPDAIRSAFPDASLRSRLFRRLFKTDSVRPHSPAELWNTPRNSSTLPHGSRQPIQTTLLDSNKDPRRETLGSRGPSLALSC